MIILHIVAGVWPGSGIAEVVAGLSSATRLQGHDVTVVTLDGLMAASIEKAQSMGVRVVRFKPSQPHFLFFSWTMLRGLGQEVREADVVHVHGCWTFPVWWGAWLALRYKKTLVMSPHGSFNPLILRSAARQFSTSPLSANPELNMLFGQRINHRQQLLNTRRLAQQPRKHDRRHS